MVMKLKELIPWSREKEQAMSMWDNGYPFLSLQKEMNRVFDDFSKSGFDHWPMSREMKFSRDLTPKIDIVENGEAFKVTAELPGMEEKDIDVSFSNDMLVIKGEKKEEKDEKNEDYCLTERSYGSFQRAIPISAGVDRDKVDAKFKNGVLKITLPKTEEAQKENKKIDVKKG
jgi:HSP20 family protein